MPKQKVSRREKAAKAGPPYFTGFPYLVTYVVQGLTHIILLPADLERPDLEEIARRQVLANKLEACLVLGEGDCLVYQIDASLSPSENIPLCSTSCTGRLRPCFDFMETDEFVMRRKDLVEFTDATRRPGFLFGDLTKGGRPATPDELARLAGFQEGNVPVGLVRCEACGEWRGECLDPNPIFRGKLMRVTCLCQNDNRCARCGEGLSDHKLRANYFDPIGGGIWYTPGFSALSHKCPDLRAPAEANRT